MVEIETYEVRSIIKYISMSKQSTRLMNVFNNTILGVICKPEKRFNDLVQDINQDIKRDNSQNMPWQYWTCHRRVGKARPINNYASYFSFHLQFLKANSNYTVFA